MALNTTPRTWTSGELLTAALLNTEVRDALTGIQAAWTDWDTTITTGGSAITLGNGAIDGAWTRVGKTVHFRIRFTVGSTTVLPAGTVLVTVPVAGVLASNGAAGGYATQAPIGAGSWRMTSATQIGFNTAAGNTGNVTNMGLVSGTVLVLSGTYEAA